MPTYQFTPTVVGLRRYSITITYNVLSGSKLQQLLNGSTQVKYMYKIRLLCLPRAAIRAIVCVKLVFS